MDRPTREPKTESVELSESAKLKAAKIGAALKAIHAAPVVEPLPDDLAELLGKLP